MQIGKLVFVILFLFVIGCKGPEGDTGDAGAPGQQGEKGDPGKNAEFEIYTGTIPGDGIMGIVSIGSAPLPSNTQVTVLYAFPSVPDIWIELGQPDSAIANPFCGVNYEDAEVGFFNCLTTWFYKIIVIKPALSPRLSAKERFDFFRF